MSTLVLGLLADRARTPSARGGPGQSQAVLPGPPYIVAIDSGKRLSVRDAATGKELDAFERPARLELFGEVAATGDPRTFFVAGLLEDARKSTIYRLRLAANGEVETLEPVVTVKNFPHNLAATKDGTHVAYTCGDWCGNVDRIFDRVTVVDLRTGDTRQWTGDHGGLNGTGSTADLSWTADSRKLIFVWMPESYTESRKEIRVLDTRTKDRDLLSSRVVLSNERSRELGQDLYQAAVSPDGRTILAAFGKARWGVQRPGKQGAIFRLSADTGKPQEVVATFSAAGAYPLIEMDTSGKHLLLYRGDNIVGRFDDGEFRPLFRLRGAPGDFAW